MTRRHFLQTCAAAGLTPLVTLNAQSSPGSKFNIQEFIELDRAMKAFIGQNYVPGASLSVGYQGRLLFAEGYGFAERETQLPCLPNTIYRVGSISKFISTIVVLELVEQRLLRLDQKAFSILDIDPYLPAGKSLDPRIHDVTIEMLLRHTAGFSKRLHYGFSQIDLQTALGIPPEKQTMNDFVRFRISEGFDATPGTAWEYNNFDFDVIGAIVEKVTGHPFESALDLYIRQPLKVRDLHVAHTRREDRFPTEAVYYDAYELIDHQMFSSVHPSNRGKMVPWSYGAALFENSGPAGGLVASMPTLCRLMSAASGDDKHTLLSKTSQQKMVSPAPGSVGHKPDGSPFDHYYGMGCNVDWYPGDVVVIYHGGGLPGSSSWIKRWETGIVAAMSCNTSNKAQNLAMKMIEPVREMSARAIRNPQALEIDLYPRWL